MSLCCINIWYKEYESNAHCKQAKDCPTDETEMQEEQIHLVSVHHLHALLYGSIVLQFWIVLQNVVSHAI